ncbi:MAG: hypothetical protein GY861_28055 [bacterium]|nr:hypothetical protein [bacterium]
MAKKKVVKKKQPVNTHNANIVKTCKKCNWFRSSTCYYFPIATSKHTDMFCSKWEKNDPKDHRNLS